MNEIELRYAIHRLLTGAGKPDEVRSCALVSPSPGEPIALRVVTADAADPDIDRTYTVIIAETDRHLLCVAPLMSGNSDDVIPCPELREDGAEVCPKHRRYGRYVSTMTIEELLS